MTSMRSSRKLLNSPSKIKDSCSVMRSDKIHIMERDIVPALTFNNMNIVPGAACCKTSDISCDYKLSADAVSDGSLEERDHKLHQMRIFNFDLERDIRMKSAEIRAQQLLLDDAIAEAAQSALEAREASMLVDSMSQLTGPRLLRQIDSLLMQLKGKSEQILALQETISRKDFEINNLRNQIAELSNPLRFADSNPQEHPDAMSLVLALGDLALAEEQTVVIF